MAHRLTYIFAIDWALKERISRARARFGRSWVFRSKVALPANDANQPGCLFGWAANEPKEGPAVSAQGDLAFSVLHGHGHATPCNVFRRWQEGVELEAYQ